MRFISIVLLFAFLIPTTGTASEPIYDIPKMTDIVLDGNDDDWKEDGLFVPIHATENGRRPPSWDLTASVRLGWDAEGLLVLVRVFDNCALENPDPKRLWSADSVELFLAPQKGSEDIFQVVFAPGMTKTATALRQKIYKHGAFAGEKNVPDTLKAERISLKQGYQIETRIPWQPLGITPDKHAEVAFQIFINDSDTPKAKTRLQWYPHAMPHTQGDHGESMQRLRLSDAPGGPASITAYSQTLPENRIRITVFGAEQDKGTNIFLKQDEQQIYSGTLNAFLDGVVADVIEFTPTIIGNGTKPVDVFLGDIRLARIPIPRPALSGRLDDALPFASSIRAFQKEDQNHPPAPGGILFVGSSSIRMWKTVKEDMAPLPVLNRGFGGSQIWQVLLHAERIVYPYRPKTIVLYCGENDVSAKRPVSKIVADTLQFFNEVHQRFPQTRIYYIPMKPSIARWKLWPQMNEGNEKLRAAIEPIDYVEYVDLATPMLLEDGTPRTDIWLKDHLHMNATGYKLWTKILKPILEKRVKQ